MEQVAIFLRVTIARTSFPACNLRPKPVERRFVNRVDLDSKAISATLFCAFGNSDTNRDLGISSQIMAKDATPAEQAEICAVYLRAMADPVRIQIIKALQAGPLTVTDLAELLELEMQNVSHHLRVLYHAHLVAIRKEGKFSYYHLNEEFLHHRGVAKSLDFGCCRIDIRE